MSGNPEPGCKHACFTAAVSQNRRHTLNERVPVVECRYDNTETGIQALGYGGLVYFVLFFYITNYQFLRIFVAIIAQNYELSEDEKLKVCFGCQHDDPSLLLASLTSVLLSS